MRIFNGILVSVALAAIAAGILTTSTQLSQVREQFELEDASQVEGGAAEQRVTSGKIELVNGDRHDFGEMERETKRSHAFVLKNVGQTTLYLDNGGTSCAACTISSIGADALKPGETTEVLVEWKASGIDPDFHKEAFVRTSDPSVPLVRLTVTGKVTQSVLIDPYEVTLGRITQSGGAETGTNVYCFRAGEFQVTGHSLQNTETADFYDVRFERLSAEELAKKPGAKQGERLTLKVKPGLPLGALAQTIRLSTSLPDVPRVDLPIHGMVIGDISIVGAKYRDENSAVTLGVVPREKGGGTMVQIIVKGPHRRDVRISIDSVEPKGVLTARLDEAKTLGDGAVLMYPLHIEVPADSAPTSRMGGPRPEDSGTIVLKTTHPTAKEVRLSVRFAVEG